MRRFVLLVAAHIAPLAPFVAGAQTAPPFELALFGREEIVWPHGQGGYVFLPDGPISYRKFGNEIRMWFVSGGGTVLFRGSSFDAMTPYVPANGKFVLAPAGGTPGFESAFDADYAGAYGVLLAANGTDLIMFYHGERHPCGGPFPFMASIGSARSTDGGFTWVRQGEILSSVAPKPTDCTFPVWGVGNLTPFRSRDHQNIQMLFMEWLRGNPVRRPDVIYEARASVASDGVPGAWQKYSNGAFSAPGFGGLGSIVINQPPPDGATTIYAGSPSVSFNSSLGRYLTAFQSATGFYVASSDDGIAWDTPRLVWQVGDLNTTETTGSPWVAYPTLLSPDESSQETTAESGFLYYARGKPGASDHSMARQRFAIGVGPLRITASAPARTDSIIIGQTTPHADSVTVQMHGFGMKSAQWSASAAHGSWIADVTPAGTDPISVVRWTRRPPGTTPGLYIDTISVAMSNGGGAVTIIDSLRLVEPDVSADCAARDLLGASCLTDIQRRFLDVTGNNDQAFNLGDLLAFLDRKKISLDAGLAARLVYRKSELRR
jgi:hypothetical protein